MPQKLEQNGLEKLPKIVYQPKKYEETQMERFKKMIEKEFNLKFNDYFEFHEWSYKNYPEFWDCVWRFFGIVHSKPYSQVYDRKNGFESMEWFKDARLNYAQNLLKYRDSEIAIISTDAEDDTVYISYQQLYDEVRVYVKAMRNEGIKKGDNIACYMSNKKEAVFAFLATAAMGAVWCGCLPLLGPKATLSRFEQINPKILFAAGNFTMESREFNMDEKIFEIVANLPSLQKVVYCPTKLKSKANLSEIPKCVFISEFLQEAREEIRNDPKDIEFEQLPFDHPLCISFTSGTTGAPKGLVHSAGMYFANLKDYGLHQNLTRKDVMLNLSPNGWISWNMNVNALHLGLSVVMYDGDPFEESPTRFWDLVDKFGLTSMYLWSSTIDDMDINGRIPTPKHSLKSLRQILPNGSPAKPSAFDFLSEKVKPGMFCSPAYGTTEVFGLLSGVDHNLPVYRGEIQLPSLGMDVRILDEKGNPVIGQRGTSVLANPYPALPVRLLNDENKEKVTEMYLAEHPGYWNNGDDAWQNPITKGFIVYGRSDETMDPKGARYNCSDIYFALEGFSGVKDSVVVSQYNKDMDERVILFVKMFPGHELTDKVKEKINETIEHHLTYEHIPDIIMEAPDIPYNLTGKKLNGLVKKLINKKPIANVDIVINPSSVEFFKNVELGEF
ncbi:Acetoacetyl-CoA synthetase [Araneus ventricosus]|uniref:Acetoacetyl-CoA synthetase n=1 Tax=Araneus ventricosus TaxID=182803 RepID=A0A4Y2FX65_ARAVE|nr:Acetoacetyl-CoA synthetase [Araneus ventricosus]